MPLKGEKIIRDFNKKKTCRYLKLAQYSTRLNRGKW